jgi:hypothetical protein
MLSAGPASKLASLNFRNSSIFEFNRLPDCIEERRHDYASGANKIELRDAVERRWVRIDLHDGRPVFRSEQRQTGGRMDKRRRADAEQHVTYLARFHGGLPFGLRQHFAEPDDTGTYKAVASVASWRREASATVRFVGRFERQRVGLPAFEAKWAVQSPVKM